MYGTWDVIYAATYVYRMQWHDECTYVHKHITFSNLPIYCACTYLSVYLNKYTYQSVMLPTYLPEYNYYDVFDIFVKNNKIKKSFQILGNTKIRWKDFTPRNTLYR